jgi:hypothetical protein
VETEAEADPSVFHCAPANDGRSGIERSKCLMKNMEEGGSMERWRKAMERFLVSALTLSWAPPSPVCLKGSGDGAGARVLEY